MYHVSIKHKLNWIVKQSSLCNKILLYKSLKFRVCKINSVENFLSKETKENFSLFVFSAEMRTRGNWNGIVISSHPISLRFNQRSIKFNNVNNIKENEQEKWYDLNYIWTENLWFNATLLVNFTLTTNLLFQFNIFEFLSIRQPCTMLKLYKLFSAASTPLRYTRIDKSFAIVLLVLCPFLSF